MPSSVIAQIVGHFYTDAPRQLSAHAARQTQLQNLFNHTLADTADLHDAVTRFDPIMDAMRINNDLEGESWSVIVLSYAYVAAASESFQKHYAQSANRHMHDTDFLLQCLLPLLPLPRQNSSFETGPLHMVYRCIRANYHDLMGRVDLQGCRLVRLGCQLGSLELRLKEFMFVFCSIRRLCTTTRIATAQVWEQYRTLFRDILSHPRSG